MNPFIAKVMAAYPDGILVGTGVVSIAASATNKTLYTLSDSRKKAIVLGLRAIYKGSAVATDYLLLGTGSTFALAMPRIALPKNFDQAFELGKLEYYEFTANIIGQSVNALASPNDVEVALTLWEF